MKPKIVQKFAESKFAKQFQYWFRFIFLDKNQRIRAGSLAYFSLIGLVPFVSFFLWFTDSINTDTEVSPVFETLLPGLSGSFEEIEQYAQTSNETMFSTWVGWLAVLIILYFLYCIFINIQRVFNNIWKSIERPVKGKLGVIGISLLVCASVLLLCSYIFVVVQSHVLRLIFTSIVLYLCIAAAYYYLPYDKKPDARPVFISSAITTVLLFVWAQLIPVIDNFVATYQSQGLLVFLLVFWMYWAWFIILFGAKLCRHIDKSGEAYLKNELDRISPFFVCYLSMIAVSYVFRKSNYSNGGLSFTQIRKGMFLTENDSKNSEAFLPMPLLTHILDELCDYRNVLTRRTADGSVKYIPAIEKTKVATYTVGDFLYDYYFSGGSISTYRYQDIHSELESSLSSKFLSVFAQEATPLIELVPDRELLYSAPGLRKDEYGTRKRSDYDGYVKTLRKEVKARDYGAAEGQPSAEILASKPFWKFWAK